MPNLVKEKLLDEIAYILDHIVNNNTNSEKFNKTKLNLIKKIYDIFKNKKSEIEKNKNRINLSTINNKELEKLSSDFQKIFFFFSKR